MTKHGSKKSIHPGIVFLILVLLFFIPLGAAWLLYSDKLTLGESKTNRGKLITPPFSIALLKISNEKGQPLINKRLTKSKIKSPNVKLTNGKWLMLFVYPGECNTQCQKGIYNMRQIRIATGKNQNRIGRALLSFRQDKKDPSLKRLLATKYRGTRHFYTKQANFQSVVHEKVKANYALKPGTLYLVDPFGNVMMSYAPGTSPTSVFKDIQRLLKVSQIG